MVEGEPKEPQTSAELKAARVRTSVDEASPDSPPD